ncbi:AAA-ATPase At3g50940-like [Impatiens glandulifera]|uniref:AAA-ATPase At3g50940-like n=1 Tax=Impatiens glandulifera TaxID=253017 RepID=UPI001FB162DD|nr:AAA-ATPase At3g50940-like [Impatiens glandulifera]
MFSDVEVQPSLHKVISTAASVAATVVLIRSISRDLIPDEFRYYLKLGINTIYKSISSEITLIVEELDGFGFNQLYKAAEIYLGSKIFQSTSTFRVTMPDKDTNIHTSMAGNEEMVDHFNGAQFKWIQVTQEVKSSRTSSFHGEYSTSSSSQSSIRYYRLVFNKRFKQLVFDSYFPFVIEESRKLKEQRKTLKIFTLGNEHARRYSDMDSSWSGVNLVHPATFDTLAMDGDMKKMIIEDLNMFIKRKEFYRTVGKAWKRGYLLYGPPGTGKSSLIAAIANYLNFDIYDLELTAIRDNGDLRRLLISTANQSILVVEDIDCSLDLEDRKTDQRIIKALQSTRQPHTINIVKQQHNNHKTNQVTLSGILNFIDGLWSSCGDERIIIFTTNHKDRLDLALLRPGRMDLHVHMSYCTFCGFQTLAKNYLGLTEHALFDDVKSVLEMAMATPAEIAEQLLKSEQPETALGGVVRFLKDKIMENEEKEALRIREEEEEFQGKGVQVEENKPTIDNKMSTSERVNIYV